MSFLWPAPSRHQLMCHKEILPNQINWSLTYLPRSTTLPRPQELAALDYFPSLRRFLFSFQSCLYLLVKRVFSIFGGMHSSLAAGWHWYFSSTICPLIEFDCIQSGLKPFTTVLLVLQQRTKYLLYVWSRWYVSPAYP